MCRYRRPERANGPSRERRWLLLVFRYLREFFLHTSQQGYKYIAQPGRSMIERFFWGVVISFAVVMATYIIILQWDFHLSRYTITTLEAAHYPVWHIPFPALTVCSINKVQKSAAQRLAADMKLPEGVTQSQAVEDLGLLVELIEPGEINVAKLERLQSILDVNNYSIPALMKELHRIKELVSPPTELELVHGIDKQLPPDIQRLLTAPNVEALAPSCEEMLVKCRWKGIFRDCSDLFIIRKSHEGYCCSFNYLAIQDDLVKNAVDLNMKDPRRISSSGQETGLSVLVMTEPEEYHATVHASYGVKVLFHDSYDYPGMNVVKKMVPLGSEMFFSLQPWITYSTESVRSVNKYRRGWRGCQFPDEQQLHFMKQYSYDNCVMECRNNVTAEKCGCRPFYFPSDGTNSHRICNLLDVPCNVKNKKTLQTMYPGNDEKDSDLEQGPVTYPCNCLPDCQNIYYPTEDYEGQLASMTSNSRAMFMEAMDTRNHSVFHVFFGNFMATSYRRTILYSWQSLLGSFGGLLSLFIGFSLISGFELFYFFTIRLFYIVRSKRWFEAQTGEITGIQNILHTCNPIGQKGQESRILLSTHPIQLVRPYIRDANGGGAFGWHNE